MTNEPEMKFLLDHFDEYMEIKKEQIQKNTGQKRLKSPVAEYIKSKRHLRDYIYS